MGGTTNECKEVSKLSGKLRAVERVCRKVCPDVGDAEVGRDPKGGESERGKISGRERG